MTAWAVVALALTGSFASAVAAGRWLSKTLTAAAVEMAAMERERERLEVDAEAARLLAALRLNERR